MFNDTNFPSVGSARRAAEIDGWTMLHIMNRDFDFCQVCQRDASEQLKKAKGQGA